MSSSLYSCSSVQANVAQTEEDLTFGRSSDNVGNMALAGGVGVVCAPPASATDELAALLGTLDGGAFGEGDDCARPPPPGLDALLESALDDPWRMAHDLLWRDCFGQVRVWRQTLRSVAALASSQADCVSGVEGGLFLLLSLPEDLGRAETELAQAASLGAEELTILLEGLQAPARIASTARFIQELFGSAAAQVAERLHAVALTRAPKGQDARSFADSIYSKAMPGRLAEEDVTAGREGYRRSVSFPVDGETVVVQVQTPYHISSRNATATEEVAASASVPPVPGMSGEDAAGRNNVAWGKGEGEDVEAVMQRALDQDQGGVARLAADAWRRVIAEGKGEGEARAAAAAAIEHWMSEQNIGVDCSGFTFHTAVEQDPAVLGRMRQMNPKLSDHQILLDRANVRQLTSARNATPIPPAAARPGDYVRNTSQGHIGVVESAPREVLVSSITDAGVAKAVSAGVGSRADATALQIGIAHSMDGNGAKKAPDGPGPHLGQYWFHPTTGAPLATSDKASAKFALFFRPLITPPNSGGAAHGVPGGEAPGSSPIAP